MAIFHSYVTNYQRVPVHVFVHVFQDTLGKPTPWELDGIGLRSLRKLSSVLGFNELQQCGHQPQLEQTSPVGPVDPAKTSRCSDSIYLNVFFSWVPKIRL